MARHDQSLLEAALVGYEQEKQRIERAMADIRARVGGRQSAATADGKPARKKRRISAEGRARIAEAQRKRWAAAKRAK